MPLASGPKPYDFVESTLSHRYVKPGSRLLLTWRRTDDNAKLWDTVNQVRKSSGFQLTACYCSIFEQCWVVSSTPAAKWPAPVKSCAVGRPESIGAL